MRDKVKKYLTQREVAELFRVSQSTVKNWRDTGLRDYFQSPGSSRVLYPKTSIEAFETNYTRRANIMEIAHPVKTRRETALMPSKSKKLWKI